MSARDKGILRELGARVEQLAQSDANRERAARARAINSLEPCRPIVWIDEIPWHEMEMDGGLTLQCEGEWAQNAERGMRRTLHQWRHFQADMVVEDAFYITRAMEATDTGIRVEEDVVATDAANHIVSHQYHDVLDTGEKVDALRLPVVTTRPDIDARNLELAHEVFDGVRPVRLRGHGIYHAPWDEISRLRGVEAVLVDMVDRPWLLHKTMEKFMAMETARLEQMERQGLLDYNIKALHCTPPYVNGLPAADYDGGPVRLKDMWYRCMAQMFSTVSPAMMEEFNLQYLRPLMDRCGLVYYGCCEPLDTVLDLLMAVPNMRKLGVSPWSDVRLCAEKMGGRYVFARKPNPALVAGSFDEDAVRRETRQTIEACRANGCPYEFVLKDISTVGYRPQNLARWAQTVMETIDGYYGPAG